MPILFIGHHLIEKNTITGKCFMSILNLVGKKKTYSYNVKFDDVFCFHCEWFWKKMFFITLEEGWRKISCCQNVLNKVFFEMTHGRHLKTPMSWSQNKCYQLKGGGNGGGEPSLQILEGLNHERHLAIITLFLMNLLT